LKNILLLALNIIKNKLPSNNITTILDLARKYENYNSVKYLPLPINNELVKLEHEYIDNFNTNEYTLLIDDNSLIEENIIDNTIDSLNEYQNFDEILKLENIKVSCFHKINNFIKLKVEGFSMNKEQDYYRSSLELIYKAFTQNEDYISLSENKVVFIQGLNSTISDESKPIHNSVALSNKTTFEEYYDKVKDLISTCWEGSYGEYVSDHF
jgi:hypothetical protein